MDFRVNERETLLCHLSVAGSGFVRAHPDGDHWISGEMVERLSGTGIYEWESVKTISRLWLKKGLYVVHAQASFPGGPTATGILEFQIDPPAEDFNPLPTLVAIVMLIVAESKFLTKFIQHQPRRTSQKSNV